METDVRAGDIVAVSTSPSGGQSEFGWTLPQRRALIGLLILLLIALSVRYGLNRSYVSDPQPQGSRASELASRIDPNSATWEELAAIPSLGEKRAKAIIQHRDAARSRDPGAIVFRSASDLMRVRGIGKATAENLNPYLVFPGDQPSTLPLPLARPLPPR